jgi:hypothetical protein
MAFFKTVIQEFHQLMQNHIHPQLMKAIKTHPINKIMEFLK